MGLLDKLKNVFFEEEYVEVEEKKEPKEKVTVAKKIETPEIRKREEQVLSLKEEPVVKEEPTVIEKKEEKDFKFPLDDKDFEMEKTLEIENPIKEEPIVEKVEPIKNELIDNPPVYEEIKQTRENRYEQENVYREMPLQEEKEVVEVEHHRLYEGPIKEEEHKLYEGSKEREEQRTFKPSPIISPIYGILNKNYTKDEIMTKKEIRLSQVTNIKADLDIVREKAYGELAGDITASIEENSQPETKNIKEEKEDLVYDLNEDESPTVKVVTVGDAEEYFNDLGLEYNVDYKVEKEKSNEEATKKEEKEENEVEKKESAEDDKNLFDLIDSMYEDEKEKEKE